MGSIKIINGTLFAIEMMDALKNISLYIYQVNNKFAFRYIGQPQFSDQVMDPISQSKDFTWAMGPCSSPEEARKLAREYYLKYGCVSA